MGDLKVNSDKKQNHLSWITYSEKDAIGFEVLRSFDGNSFESIAFVKARGSESGTQNYKFSDSRSGREVYYKIKFVGEDKDDFQYSNAVVVNPLWSNAFSFYPNPVTTNLTIENEAFQEGKKIEIQILDLSGKVIVNQSLSMAAGKVSIDFRDIPSGVYLVEGFSNGLPTGKRKIVKL
jgi:hypothetical protein